MKNRRLLGILVALLVCILSIPLAGFAATESISYIDAEEKDKICSNYTVVGTSSSAKTWNAGWYVVKGGTKENPITIPGVTVKGAVHLILTDGCYLEVTGAYEHAGVTVSGKDNSLSIYGQLEGTGELNATGGKAGAGIGGNRNNDGGNITINGGTVTAKGKGAESAEDLYGGGAGIGGGDLGNGSNITINGGTVNATGGTFSAGIGGGFRRNGSYITINGGTVIATGYEGGAGIGGGDSGIGHNITITGGEVLATGGTGTDDWAAAGGAGIGGGAGNIANNITITGGNIKAVGGLGEDNDHGSGIGGGGGRMLLCDNITVADDMELEAGNSLDVLYPIYHAYDYHYVWDEMVYDAYDLGGTMFYRAYRFVIACKEGVEYQNPVYNTLKDPAAGIKEWETGTCHSYTLVETSSSAVTWNSGWYVVKGGTEENPITIPGITVNGKVRLILTDGCHFKVTGANNSAGISVSGEENSLYIYGQTEGTGELIATGGRYGAGIGGDNGIRGNKITVNGGYVTATGGEGGAGIGGGRNGTGKNIIINDGIVSATGGNAAAGIGGGRDDAGHNIYINGGMISAKSEGGNTSGIGGGQGCDSVNTFVNTNRLIMADDQDSYWTFIKNNGQDLSKSLMSKPNVSIRECVDVSYLDAEGNTQSVRATPISEKITALEAGWFVVNSNLDLNRQLTVSGDVHLILADGFTMNVQANSDDKAAIEVTNDDPENPKNSLTIYGQGEGTGTLNATGGSYSAGIGGGNRKLGSNITINGGIVNATGGKGGAGIGGGNSCNGSHITINGGAISATGGNNAAGIGGGIYGNGALIAINGGKVTATAGANASAIGGGNGIKKGSDKDIVIASFMAVKAGNGEASTIYMTNAGEDLSSKLKDTSYVQTQPYITVNEGEVLVYDQAAENFVVKGTAAAKIYYTGKMQTSSIMKPNYLADTYDDILTKSDDYQNKSDVATPLSALVNSFKKIRTDVDGISKELSGTSSYSMILSALNNSGDGISGLKGTYYGNLKTDLWSSITLNNGDFNTDENAVIIDTALRNIYTSDTDGKSVITGEKTSTCGDAFYQKLIAMGDLYIKNSSTGKDIFAIYEGVNAHVVNFNSENLENRANFNEAAMNTYESGYLMVNTAITYDLQNHINQMNTIIALQAAASASQYSAAEQNAIKKEISALEKTLGMSLDDAKAEHKACIKADQEKIDALKEQYEKVHTAWQTSVERLQKDQLMVSGSVVYCYRNNKYYDYTLKIANVNDGIPNTDSTNIADFLSRNSSGYVANVKSIYVEDDRSRIDTPFTNAASSSDLASMVKWAKERKTTLNEEIAKAFIIEEDENVSAQEKDDSLGIYFGGTQSAAKKDNILSFRRTVSYCQNGVLEGKDTIVREWYASDGTLRNDETDLESTVLVISNANLGGNGGDDDGVDGNGLNTGDSNDMAPWALLALISVMGLAAYGLKRRGN